MERWHIKDRFIGYLATGLLVLATSLWMYWGVEGLYRQGWWEAWYYRALYLVPGIICLGLTLSVLKWPRVGGWLLVIIGGSFTGWWWWYISHTVGLTSHRVIITFLLSGIQVVAGVLVLFNARRVRLSSEKPLPPRKWLYRNMRYLMAVGVPLLVAVVLAAAITLTEPQGAVVTTEEPEKYSETDQFRNLSVQFVRTVAGDYFAGRETQYPEELGIRGNWDIDITIYHQGDRKGIEEYQAHYEELYLALEQATRNALDGRRQDLGEEDLEGVRFLVSFSINPSFSEEVDTLFALLPFYNEDRIRSFSEYGQTFSYIEYNEEGKELIENLVITRVLDKELILEQIEQGKEFLFSAEHPDVHGFYKKYDTRNDDFGNRVHTVYSASIIYTFLKLYDYDHDERIMESVPDWADFLLSMQSKSRDEETYGAFHYSYYFETGEKQQRFVVGTTALSIFTLLDLYQRTGDSRYLESAKLGGDWLITMQKPDGVMKALVNYDSDVEMWVYGTKESLLYNGQVLAALSRLYLATGEQKYYDAAEKIAGHFCERVENEGCYLGDDYRKKNPISSAWVIMSLLDFYKINQDDYHKDIILRCGSDLLERQETEVSNPVYYGSWHGAYSTSGNGWLAEVVMEMYYFCREHDADECERYKDALIRVILWIIQNTYSEENTFFLEEPEKAIGGIFWNYENRYVRTDSLCHGLNAYIGILDDLEDGVLLSLPEAPFEVILERLRN